LFFFQEHFGFTSNERESKQKGTERESDIEYERSRYEGKLRTESRARREIEKRSSEL
jgi:hypothetical protein